MDVLVLALTVSVLPVLAFVADRVASMNLSERHHFHHDTYSISMVVLGTIGAVMAFMGVLGLLTGWLCHLGVFAADPRVPLAFFTAFQLTLLVMRQAVGRYQVMTYDDRLLVRPAFGPTQELAYDDISRMQLREPWWGGSVRDLFVETRDGGSAKVWGLIDVDQILVRIDHFDLLEA